MTVKRIIIRYLELNPGVRIANHIFETVVPQFGQNVYGILHSPGTYSRAWRDLREKNELPKYGFSAIEVETNNSKEKYFVVRRLSEVHRNSEGSSQQAGNNNPVSGIKETPAT